MIVGLIALFVALGGTTYAVQRLPRRSVGAAQLRRDAVRNQHVKAGAISRSKIRRKAVTDDQVGTDALLGRNILESSLGKVPDSDKLDGRDATRFVRAARISRFSLVDGEERVIHRAGPLALTATCVIDAGAQQTDTAQVVLSTVQSGAAFDGEAGGDADLTTAGTATVVEAQANLAAPGFAGSSGGQAVAPDGAEIPGMSLNAAVNLPGQTGRCSFGGYVLE
jgi:hypothetical protein